MASRVAALEVGRVTALWRYPVKSMGGESLREVHLRWHGLAGDRRWAFVRDDRGHSGFPWRTLRERPDMARYRPAFVEPERPDASPMRVRTPAGTELDVADPALAAELGGGIGALKSDRGVFDALPLSLITTQTLASLGALVDGPLTVERFRPNLVVEAAGDAPFPEDAWVGAVLQVGQARLRIDARDQRCMIVNLDPLTGAQEPAVLRAVARTRDARLGVYGSTVEPGLVAVGDSVLLVA